MFDLTTFVDSSSHVFDLKTFIGREVTIYFSLSLQVNHFVLRSLVDLYQICKRTPSPFPPLQCRPLTHPTCVVRTQTGTGRGRPENTRVSAHQLLWSPWPFIVFCLDLQTTLSSSVDRPYCSWIHPERNTKPST